VGGADPLDKFLAFGFKLWRQIAAPDKWKLEDAA